MKQKIQTETKTGIKRKLEKVEVKTIKTKTPLKADLIVQLKKLQDNFDTLEEANTKNIEKIKFLEEKVESLEKEKIRKSKETQTENSQELKCSECNFEASNDSELNWHMGKIHGWPLNQSTGDLDYSAGPIDCKRCDYQAEDGYDLDAHRWSEHEEDEDGQIICKICEEKFASVGNLMKHKKLKHREKVSVCQNYNTNGCPFEDHKCWFLHMQSEEEFKCNICEENFKSKSDFMRHRKSNRSDMVQYCKNNKKCVFKNSCWFRHGILDEQVMNGKSDEEENIINKLLKNIEKLNEKVIKLENMLEEETKRK